MCHIRNTPISGRYQSPHFGHHADFCMVGVIKSINNEQDCTTVASCCGHHDSSEIPYITVVLPPKRIPGIKSFLSDVLGWSDVSVNIWNDLPDMFVSQMGENWLVGKVYAGFYNMTDEDNPGDYFCYVWREDGLQMA